MILTCLACASRYLVDDAKLPPQGRRVRCTACGESWHVEPNGDPLDLTPELAPAAPVIAELDATTPAEILPKAFRQQVQAQRRTRKAVAAGVVWAATAAGLILAILTALVFRVQMVRVWPRTAGAYAALRLPVNPVGLTPDGVSAAQVLQNGHAALVVSGAERNIETWPLAPAPMRVSLYDPSGARLVSRIVEIGPEAIAPGNSRAFATTFVDPPLSGAQIGVDFVFEPGRRLGAPSSAYAQATPTQAPRLRGLEGGVLPPPRRPKTAQALPASSPFALPAAARVQAQ